MLFGATLQVVADSELFHSALVHLRAALNITEKVRPQTSTDNPPKLLGWTAPCCSITHRCMAGRLASVLSQQRNGRLRQMLMGGAAPALQVPKVGGRQLDLHVLYCSVTALGGCEEVIARKQWRVRSSHTPGNCRPPAQKSWSWRHMACACLTHSMPPSTPNAAIAICLDCHNI